MWHITSYSDETYLFSVCHSEERHIRMMVEGKNHLARVDGKRRLYTYDGYIELDASADVLFDEAQEEDVFLIHPNGVVYREYDASTDDNALVFTMQCNSNCVMCPCSEASRKNGVLRTAEELVEMLRYMPATMRHLTLTGGEPTLLKEEFFAVMRYVQTHFGETHFQLLTNGRAFGDYRFTKRFVECLPDHIDIGIPLYGHNEQIHDAITSSPGSFKQTVIGIRNLLHYHMDIELRVVVMRDNIDDMDNIARYIMTYLSGVSKVTFMGLELMGNAAKNKERVWVPYDEAVRKSERAIRMLVASGMDVRLYNFPLCKVPESLWSLCANSISDHKIQYHDACTSCAVKSACGGIFESTKRMADVDVKPISR